MNSSNDLLKIICTEAAEHYGIQEVPDDKFGASQYYHSAKREARGPNKGLESVASSMLPAIDFKLELIENEDGSIDWNE